MSVKDFVQQRRDDFIALRRDFHMYPEPAWLEYRSAAKVAEKLIALGYDVALGAEVLDLDSRMGLPSEDVMTVVAFRADMDSNDVIESKASNHTPAKKGFRSRHEKAMHACGHDTHMTMGLGLAEYIATHKEGLKGTIKLIFQ